MSTRAARNQIDAPAHHEFTDVVVPAEQRAVLPGAGQVDGDFAIPRVNGVVRGFLDRYLKGTGSFPQQQIAAFPEVRNVDLTPIRDWATRRGSTVTRVR